MRRLLAALAIAGGAALIAAPTPASAEIVYPWCAQYGGGLEGSNGTNCGFSTWKQCWDTVSGGRIGGCYENPAYLGPTPPPRHKKRRSHAYD